MQRIIIPQLTNSILRSMDFRLKHAVCEKCLSTGYLADVVRSGEDAISQGGLDFEGTAAERAYWEDMKWS